MATFIGWTDETWNIAIGCDRVSEGCDNCYAILQANLRAGNPHPKVAAAFAGVVEHNGERLDWTGKINVFLDRLDKPFRWRRPRKIFVNSLSDMFHKGIAASFTAKVFAVMALTPHHTYQILTKRPGPMKALLNSPEFAALVEAEFWKMAAEYGISVSGFPGLPLSNLWLGVSVENQKSANLRLPLLLSTQAAVRFVSAEPLLGPVDMLQAGSTNGIDWVIVGGESGPKARPMSPDWARDMRDQCLKYKIAFNFKQWGSWAPTGWQGIGLKRSDRHTYVGEDLDGFGHRWEMERVGKTAAGRELDGFVWDEYPEVAHA